MMYSGGFFGPILFLGVLGHLAIAVGIVLLLAWAIKHFPAEKLKHMALWWLGIGVILAILTSLSGFSMHGFTPGMGGGNVNYMMRVSR